MLFSDRSSQALTPRSIKIKTLFFFSTAAQKQPAIKESSVKSARARVKGRKNNRSSGKKNEADDSKLVSLVRGE